MIDSKENSNFAMALPSTTLPPPTARTTSANVILPAMFNVISAGKSNAVAVENIMTLSNSPISITNDLSVTNTHEKDSLILVQSMLNKARQELESKEYCPVLCKSSEPLSLGKPCEVPQNVTESLIQRVSSELNVMIRKQLTSNVYIKLKTYALGRILNDYKNEFSSASEFIERMKAITGYKKTTIYESQGTADLYDLYPLLILSSLSQSFIGRYYSTIKTLFASKEEDKIFWSGASLEEHSSVQKELSRLQQLFQQGQYKPYGYSDITYETEIMILLPYDNKQRMSKGMQKIFELLVPDRKDGAFINKNKNHQTLTPLQGCTNHIIYDFLNEFESKIVFNAMEELNGCNPLHRENQSRGVINSGHYGWTRYYDVFGSFQGLNKQVLDIIGKLNWLWEKIDDYISIRFPAQAVLLDKVQPFPERPYGGRLFRKWEMLAVTNDVVSIHKDSNSIFCGHCVAIYVGNWPQDTAYLHLHNIQTSYDTRNGCLASWMDNSIEHSLQLRDVKEWNDKGYKRWALVLYSPRNAFFTGNE